MIGIVEGFRPGKAGEPAEFQGFIFPSGKVVVQPKGSDTVFEYATVEKLIEAVRDQFGPGFNLMVYQPERTVSYGMKQLKVDLTPPKVIEAPTGIVGLDGKPAKPELVS